MSTPHFSDFSVLYKPRVDDRLQQVFEQAHRDIGRHETSYRELLDELQVLVGRGGKRLRPLLCLLAHDGYSGQHVAASLDIAAAQELIHTFLLIHDDIIDRDCQRWGGPNILGVYFERFSATMSSREALHQAESQALLAGDICLTLANQLILGSQLPLPTIQELNRRTQATMLQVMSGELSDCTPVRAKLTPAAIIDAYARKTASYSFTLPLQSGALVANAKPGELQKLAKAGTAIGVAYQLHDDILGMFGNAAQIGKPVLSDLQEGKQTLLMAIALERATPASRRALCLLHGMAEAGPSELKQAQAIITDSGALAAVQVKVTAYLHQAEKVVAATKMHIAVKQYMLDLLQVLAKRST